ncbi:uncharacterized protein LOC144448792 isoform X2 [Glandiceps talaboti]
MDPLYPVIAEEITQETDNTLTEETTDWDSFDILIAYDTDIQRWQQDNIPNGGSNETLQELNSFTSETSQSVQSIHVLEQNGDILPNSQNNFDRPNELLESDHGSEITQERFEELPRSNVVGTTENLNCDRFETPKTVTNFEKSEPLSCLTLHDPSSVEVKGHMSDTSRHTDTDSVVSGSGSEGGAFGVYSRGSVTRVPGRIYPSNQINGSSRASSSSSSSFGFLNYNQPVHPDTSVFPQRDLHHLAEEVKRKRSLDNVRHSSTSTVESGDGISVGSWHSDIGGSRGRRDSRDSLVFQPVTLPSEEGLGDITLGGEPIEQVIPRGQDTTPRQTPRQTEQSQQSVEELSTELSDLEKEIKQLVLEIYSERDTVSEVKDTAEQKDGETSDSVNGASDNMETVITTTPNEETNSKVTDSGASFIANPVPGVNGPTIPQNAPNNANIDIQQLVNSVIAGNPTIKPATAEQIAAVIANAERQYRERQQQEQLQNSIGPENGPDTRTSSNELTGNVHEQPIKLPAPESFKPLHVQHDVIPDNMASQTRRHTETESSSDDTVTEADSEPDLDNESIKSGHSEATSPKPTSTSRSVPSARPMTLIGQNTGLAVMSAVGSKFSHGDDNPSSASSPALYRSPVESIIATASTNQSIVSGKKTQDTPKSSKTSKKSGSRKKHNKPSEINTSQSVDTMSNASDVTSQTGSIVSSRDSSLAGSAPHTPKSEGKPKSGSFFSSIFSWGGNREEGLSSNPHDTAERYGTGDHGIDGRTANADTQPQTHPLLVQDNLPTNENHSDSGIDLNQANTSDVSETTSVHTTDGMMPTPRRPRSTNRQSHVPGYDMSAQRVLKPLYHSTLGSESQGQDVYSLMREKAMLEGQLETMSSEAKSAIKERAELQSQMAALKVQLRNQSSSAQNAVHERSALAVDLDTLKQNRAQLQQNILELQSSLDSKDNTIRKLTDEAKASQEANEKLFQKLEQLRVNITTKETSVTMLKDKIAALQHELAAAQQDKSHSAGEIASLETDIQALVNTKEWFQDQLQQAQDSRSKLQKELTKARTNAVTQGTLIENLKTENARIRQQLTETQQKALLEKEMLAKHLEAIESDMLKREHTFDQMNRERSAAEEAVSLRMQKVEEEKHQLTNLITTSVQLEQQLEKTKRELYVKEAALAVLEEEKKELVKRLTLAQESITSRDHQIESLESRCVDLEVKLKEIRSETSGQDELVQQLKEEKIALESALASANEEKRSFDMACQNLQSDMGKVEKSFKLMKQELQAKTGQLDDVQQEKQLLQDKMEVAKQQLAEQKKNLESRSVDITGKNRLVEELKINKASLEGDVTVMSKKIQILENDYQAMASEKENMERDLIGVQENISELKTELQSALEGKAHLEGQIEMMSAERETYTILIEENNHLKQTLAEQQSMSHREIADQRAKILRLGSDLKNAQKELKEKHRSYESTVGTLTKKLKETMETKQRAELELQSVHSQVQTVKAEEHEKLEAELQELRVELETTQIRKQTLEAELHELQVKMVDDTNEYSSRIAKLERDLYAAREYNEHQRRAEELNRKMALELERERGRLAGVKQSHDALKHHTSVLETALARRESSLTEMVSQLQTLKHDKEEEENKLQERIDELVDELEKEKSLVIEYKTKMNSEMDEKEKLQRQAQILTSDVEQLQTELDSKTREVHSIKEDMMKVKEIERQQRTEKEQLQLHLKGSRLQVDRMKRQLEEKEAQDPVIQDQIQTLSWENEQFQHEVEALREQLALAENRQQIEIDSIRTAFQTSKMELDSLRQELAGTRKEKFMHQAKVTELKGILKATVQQNKMLKSQLHSQSAVEHVSTGTQSQVAQTSNQEVQHNGDMNVPELTLTAETALQAINTDQLINSKDDSKPLQALKSCLGSLREQMSMLQTQMDEHTNVVQNSTQSWSFQP